MAARFYAIPTNQGNAIMANALLLGQKVNITTFLLGDGGGAFYQPTADMTQLRGEVWRGSVNNAEIDSTDPNVINFSTIIPFNVGGFTVREMGIADDLGRLIGVANTPDMQLVHFEDGVTAESEFEISIAFTHPQVLEWKIDPTMIIARKRDIQLHDEAQEAHPFLLQKFATDMAAHNSAEGAHPYLLAELTNKVNRPTSGTWTPILTGATIAGSITAAVLNAAYYRIGDMCFLRFRAGNMQVSGATGHFTISGLPFPTGGYIQQGLSISDSNGINQFPILPWLNNEQIQFLVSGSVVAASRFLQAENIPNGTYISFSGWYLIAT